ncbi:MAG: hypothetical protein H0T75_12815 [Rhizobiales bacterium]|jgi:hypothetical protein|nr:hypothetical protein [Hyphomicrobiales bacterium]
MIAKLTDLLRRVETWPPEVQEEAIAILETIDEERLTNQDLSPEDIQALEQSAEDVRLGRFADEIEVREILDRFRSL